MLGRYFLGTSSDWQDELSTFLLIGATFASASWTQARRGHVSIDVLAHVLPPAANRVRRLLADLCAAAFCGFFAWKSLQLLMEAIDEGQITGSAWGPPLWIPYTLHEHGHGIADRADPAAGAGRRRWSSRADEPAFAWAAVRRGDIAALFSGIPIAFALGGVATLFMLVFMPAASVDTIAQNVYEELASITLLTIPLFILKGAAIGKSRGRQRPV